eukprot:CAMPEP_0178407110 /NCGR_PEP_ID=MMETSP0689_2-20121128/19259_1 /TAXON_ID=160604 /ORGANISM="Amphidinium massartii, Strain CS-259" /LENGTH=148 /DNA_ID=CAMNT_0020028173 /DNA_START=326 /DNA_END=772 /DNA_ORIENTATION=-
MAMLKVTLVMFLVSTTGVFLQGCGKDNSGGGDGGNSTSTAAPSTTTSSPDVPAMCSKYVHDHHDCAGAGVHSKDLGKVESQDACCLLCSNDAACFAWVYYKDTQGEMHGHCVTRMAECTAKPNLELVMGFKNSTVESVESMVESILAV